MKFVHVFTKEPHAKRRAEILKEHPEITKFFGVEPMTKYIAICLVFLQLYLSTIISFTNPIVYLFVVYFIGATICQTLFLINHELAHNLVFAKEKLNVYFGFFVNLPSVFPYCTAFRFYHILHHKYQGVRGLDADLPTKFEAYIMRYFIGRVIWLTFQIVIYAVRPLFLIKMSISIDWILNICTQIFFNITLYIYYGLEPFNVCYYVCSYPEDGIRVQCILYLNTRTLIQKFII